MTGRSAHHGISIVEAKSRKGIRTMASGLDSRSWQPRNRVVSLFESSNRARALAGAKM